MDHKDISVEYSKHLTNILGFTCECDFNIIPEINESTHSTISVQEVDSAVTEFFEGCLKFLKSKLNCRESTQTLNLLLGQFSIAYGVNYHLGLTDKILKPPVFCRTDEPSPGVIAEIQCPGSLWGEYAGILGVLSRSRQQSFLRKISAGFGVMHKDPKIHHLLDNASRPLSNAYLIQLLRREFGIPFFGFDCIKDSECNLIRTHSFQGLVYQNIFSDRLKKASKGELSFDYPPTQLFDQKLPLTLPFSPESRTFFSDNVRQHIAPTYQIQKDFSFFDGESHVQLESEMGLSRSDRIWILKYAGLDTNRNWGAKAVEFMSKMSKSRWSFLKKVIGHDLKNGDAWIAQKDVSTATQLNIIGGDIDHDKKYYRKSSTFMVNGKAVGNLTMYKATKEVHGSPDTFFEAGICNE